MSINYCAFNDIMLIVVKSASGYSSLACVVCQSLPKLRSYS